MAKHKTVPKKKRARCVVEKKAAGMGKKEAQKKCDVGVNVGTAYPGKGKHTKHRGRKASGHKREKCHGSVHVHAHERSCPHK